MKSIIVSLSGRSPTLSTDLFPEIELDEQFEYSCCLLDFKILNMHLSRVFHEKLATEYTCDPPASWIITINPGTWNVPDLMKILAGHMEKKDCKINFFFDKYKMKFIVKSYSDITIYPSMAQLIGFEPQKFKTDSVTEAEHRMGQFDDIDAIRVNCDLVNGSFCNGVDTHTIYEFNPSPVFNYKLIEHPHHSIYLPITKRCINSINITVTDQKGDLLDLKGGEIHCRLNITRNLKTKC